MLYDNNYCHFLLTLYYWFIGIYSKKLCRKYQNNLTLKINPAVIIVYLYLGLEEKVASATPSAPREQQPADSDSQRHLQQVLCVFVENKYNKNAKTPGIVI